MSWGLDSFTFASDARRFDHGTPSILACAACLPSLDWHAQQDLASLGAHNRRLAEALIDGCTGLGLQVTSPVRADERGGSVMCRLPATASPDTVVAALRGQHVFTDARGSTLRWSPGNVTTAAGVERLLRALRAALR